ncbi:MAG: phosphopantetheine-binding protein [Rhodobacteraceae bacterium]|nr:phosphopantetheine-binding protein [Paracoccaceae bacterium]
MTDRIYADITRIIAEQAMVDVDELTPMTRVEDLEMDSLAVVETLFAIEELYDITIPFNANTMDSGNTMDSEGFDLSTISTIVTGVEALIADKGSLT